MKRKLTKEQIDRLYAFCEEKEVKHFDVQIELVDHLACAIEEKWENDRTLSFDDALMLVANNFGASGFQRIMIAKEKAIQKRYNKIFWKYIGEFYRLPKIILTVVVSILLFATYRHFKNDKTITVTLFIGYLFLFLFYITYAYRKWLKFDIVKGKSFLLYNHFKQFRLMVFVFGFFPFNVLNLLNFFHFSVPNHPILELVTMFAITFFIIFIYGFAVYIPLRIQSDFKQEFPQFVIN